MIGVRFKVECQPDRTKRGGGRHDDCRRAQPGPAGVFHFDVARDVIDPDAVIAVEVFEDRDAMERQEAQPEVGAVVALIEGGARRGPPEWTVYEASSAESSGA